MFNLNDKVKIKANGVIGEIIDISGDIYTVENLQEGPVEGGYGDKWAIFECKATDIEHIS